MVGWATTLVGHPPLFYRHNHYDHHADHPDNYHVHQQDQANRKSLNSISSENCGIIWPQRGQPLFFVGIVSIDIHDHHPDGYYSKLYQMQCMTSELFLDQLFLSFSIFFTWPTGPNPLSKRAPQANHLFTGVVRYRPDVCVKLHFICTDHFGFSEEVWKSGILFISKRLWSSACSGSDQLICINIDRTEQ